MSGSSCGHEEPAVHAMQDYCWSGLLPLHSSPKVIAPLHLAHSPQPQHLPNCSTGTVSCPTCLGSPRVRRITPDFGKALALDPTWDMQVAARTGRWFWGRDARPADRKRLYLEYPSGECREGVWWWWWW